MHVRLLLGMSVLLFGISRLDAAPKNIILAVADDLNLDLGCYGNPVIKTPNLDRIAKEGTLFTHAFCTTASCSPSRSVILSGMYNHANGQYGLAHSVHHFSTLRQVKSLPARLDKAGYRTARIGKFHVEPAEVFPFQTALGDEARSSVEMADKCRELIASDDERPFFLYFCTADPHRSAKTGKPPYEPNLFGNEKAYPGVKEVRYDPKDVIVPPYLPDTPTCRAELAEYYQSVSRVDQGIGRLIKILEETGHWADTMILFISDNGIPFPGAKTTVYDPGLRLPCLVRNPYAASQGVRSRSMVSWVDIAPTILEFAGAPAPPNGLHGRSFLKILDKEHADGWDEVYASHTFHEVTMYYPMRVVRDRQHKLIWNIAHPLPFPFASDLYRSATWQEALKKRQETLYGQRTIAAYMHRPQFELYDLEKDPHELTNLAAEPVHSATLERLKAKIKAFEERTKDPWLHKWEYE